MNSWRSCIFLIRCLRRPLLGAVSRRSFTDAVKRKGENFNELGSIRKALESSKPDSSLERMLIGFTCKSCSERSHHVMGKLAYTKGTVIIQCPGCKSRHLIADHLDWFDKDHRLGKRTIEEILEARGESVQRSLNEVGDPMQPSTISDTIEILPDK